ncbi:MAG: hypothetical protein KBG01_02020 [Syntrophobacterales bacterium]|nr:hypothetical protein [Syntrophobacterales bacterium]
MGYAFFAGGKGEKMFGRHDGSKESEPRKGAQIIDYGLAKSRGVLSDLHFRISEYATSNRFYEEYELALYEYFEQRSVCADDEEFFPDEFFRDEEEFERFMSWYTIYFITDEQSRTFPSLYLRTNRHQLSPFEEEILKSYGSSYLTLYEVQWVEPGRDFLLKDIFAGRTLLVQDPMFARVLCKWDVLYAGLVSSRRSTFLGGFDPVIIPPQLRNFLQKEILDRFEDVRPQYGVLAEFLRINSAEISALVDKALDAYYEEPFLNNDGDLLCLATLHYRVTDPDAFSRKLDGSPLFSLKPHPSTGKKTYIWVRPAKEGQRVSDAPPLGTLVIEKNKLRAECNSRERAEKLRALLDESFLPYLRYLTTICEDPGRNPILPEGTDDGGYGLQQGLECDAWLDRENPALGGMTPREAAVAPGVRERLIDLLKEIENEDDRMVRLGLSKVKHPAFPVEKIMKELGL